MNKASIDIGSNTVQFLLVDEDLNILERKQFVTSLGKNIDATKLFDQQSMKDTFEALKICADISEKYEILPEDIIVTATEASRVVENAKSFFEDIKQKLKIRINLIGAEDEAYYSSKGFLFGSLSEESTEHVLLDIGGASTELIKVQTNPFEVLETISLPIGSVRFKSWIDNGLEKTRLREVLEGIDFGAYERTQIIGLAGTATSLMGIHRGLKEFNEAEIDASEMSFKEIIVLEKKLNKMSLDDILKEYPFLGKRVNVIQYGLQILKIIQDKVKFQSFKVSTKSLVHGSIMGLKRK